MMIQGAPVVLGGKKKSNVLAFAYTGKYNVRDNDVVELLESGEITFVEDGVIDVFMVGGGGGGGSFTGSAAGSARGGGGGGYTRTVRRVAVTANQSIPITIGAGGAVNTAGGATAFDTSYSVAGGEGATSNNGAAGGSGGGGAVRSNSDYGTGGSNGENGETGYPTSVTGGSGQATTTREFGESTGKLYAGGGGGGRYMASNTPIVSLGGSGGGGAGGWGGSYSSDTQAAGAGGANTGGGGGGGASTGSTAYPAAPGGSGGSGIVCFREAQELPELAGTWVLNERLYAPESNFTQTISGTIATAQGNAPLYSIVYSNKKMHFYISAVQIFSTYDFDTNQWANKVSSANFPGGATASDAFRAWLASNATKQS